MADSVQYFAIIGRGRPSTNPSGLARRRIVKGAFIDESLRRDMTWGDTIAIAEWDRGEELTRDLVAVSEAEAEGIVERFREKWGTSSE